MENAMSAWRIEGQYMETCNCTFLCPCITSNLTATPTEGECKAAIAMRINRGEKDGIKLDGLMFIVVLSSPKAMAEGDLTVGLTLGAHQEGGAAGLGVDLACPGDADVILREQAVQGGEVAIEGGDAPLLLEILNLVAEFALGNAMDGAREGGRGREQEGKCTGRNQEPLTKAQHERNADTMRIGTVESKNVCVTSNEPSWGCGVTRIRRPGSGYGGEVL